jgi:hypothetical protein
MGEELLRMSLISWAPAITGGADVMIMSLKIRDYDEGNIRQGWFHYKTDPEVLIMKLQEQ